MVSDAYGFLQAALIAAGVVALAAGISAVVLLHRGASSDDSAIVLKVSAGAGAATVALAIALTIWMQGR